MNFALTDEQSSLQQAAREFARAELPAIAAECERTNKPPSRALVKRFAELGFLGINVSSDLGGLGLGNIEALVVLEEFAKISSAIGFPVFESSVGPVRAIEHFAPEALKRRIVPQVCAGEMVVAVSIGAGCGQRTHRPQDQRRNPRRQGHSHWDEALVFGGRTCGRIRCLLPSVRCARRQGHRRRAGGKGRPGPQLRSKRRADGFPWRAVGGSELR